MNKCCCVAMVTWLAWCCGVDAGAQQNQVPKDRLSLNVASQDSNEDGGGSSEVGPEFGLSIQEGASLNLINGVTIDESRRFLLPLVTLTPNEFVSDDGEYFAQNQEELQTYYDLGMTYRYIDESFLRRQMQLPDEQGIAVLSADQAGDGFRNGLRNGDIVLCVDDESVDTQYDLVNALAAKRGTQRALKILRDGRPMDLVVLLAENEIETPKRYIIGVSVDEIGDVVKAQLGLTGGVAISSLTEGGPASSVGVLVHDVITKIDGEAINTFADLREAVQGSDGNAITLELRRNSRSITIDVTPVAENVDSSINPDVVSIPMMSYYMANQGDAQGLWSLGYANAFRPIHQQAMPTFASLQGDRLTEVLKRLSELEQQIQELKQLLDQ